MQPHRLFIPDIIFQEGYVSWGVDESRFRNFHSACSNKRGTRESRARANCMSFARDNVGTNRVIEGRESLSPKVSTQQQRLLQSFGIAE